MSRAAQRSQCAGVNQSGRQCAKTIDASRRYCRVHQPAEDAGPPTRPASDPFTAEVEAYLARAAELQSHPRSTVDPPVADDADGADMIDPSGRQPTRQWLRDGDDALAGLSQSQRRDLERTAEELIGNAQAARTRAAYADLFARFSQWCERIGAVAVPATPQLVAAYLVHLARYGYLTVDVDDADAQPGRLAPSTVGSVASAIRSAHLNNGYDDPTADLRVRRIIAGYARQHRRMKVQAHPLTLEEIGSMAMRCTMPSPASQRDAVLLAIATDADLPVNANRLGRLTWENVTLPDEPGMAARIDGGARSTTVWLAPGDDPATCPVRLLDCWRLETGGAGPVFPSPADPTRPMTRQAIVQLVDRVVDRLVGADHAGVTGRRGELPLLPTTTREAVIASLTAPTGEQMRDRAVIAAMFWFGLRADEAKNLDVGDVALSDRGVVVTVRVEKNRPYGDGPATAVEGQGEFIACPLRSLRDWLVCYEPLLGRRLRPGDPLFVGLNRGRQLPRLGYSGIDGLIKRWADASGISPGRYERISAHGPRAGQVVTLLQAGRSVEDVCNAQRRISTEHVYGYFRPSYAWGTGPNAGLVEQLTATAPEPAPDADELPPGHRVPMGR